MRENGPESAPEGHGRAPRADLLPTSGSLLTSREPPGLTRRRSGRRLTGTFGRLGGKSEPLQARPGLAGIGQRPAGSPPPPWVLLSPEAIRGHRAPDLGSRWRNFSVVVVDPPLAE